ncbi:MAG: cytochrome c oxidase assembly protein [Gemmatimonadaceae bacterium]
MQFWCSATNTAWTWSWKAYPGVWLFVMLIGFAFWSWNRAGATRVAVRPAPMHPLLLGGLLLLWLALDWPIGALGAGYLASVHMLQFLLIALLVPPALLAGVTREAAALLESSPGFTVIERLTRPVLALILFNAIVLVTHLPPVVDGLMRTQLGSMFIDVLWLAAGLIFWWPIMMSVPQRSRFVPPLRMLYLVGLMFSPVMFGLVGFMVYAERPLYGIYELAPPFVGFTSKADHQVAGVLMSVTGAAIAFTGLSVIFFRWSKTDG